MEDLLMATDPQIYAIGILANPACRGVASGEAGPSTTVEDSLQITPFYAKQTQS